MQTSGNGTNGHYGIGATIRPTIRAIVDRDPPKKLDAERALIGALIIGGARVLAAVGDRVAADDMADDTHARVWAAAADMIRTVGHATSAALAGISDDERQRITDVVVGYERESDVVGDAIANALAVRDAAARRRAIAIARKLINDAHADTIPLADLLRSTSAELALVRGSAALDDDGSRVVSRRMSDVDPVRILWLWPGRFALGKLSIVAGEPGVGKTQLTCAFAAAVSVNGHWPDGSRAPLGSVLFVCCEDDAADTLRPRLDAAGADPRRIHLYDWTLDAGGQRRHFDIGRHIDALSALVRRIGDVRLIVIDPVSAYMGRADSHVVAEVRQALAPLQAMAAEHAVAVIMVSHLNKASAAGGAMARVSGSGAFVAVARSAWMVGIDPRDGTKRRRLMLPLKNNIGADDRTGFAYHVESWRSGDVAASHVVFESELVDDVTPDDLVAGGRRGGTEGGADGVGRALGEAIAFLKTELADGPKPSTWVEKAARAAGVATRTLKRARDELGVAARRDQHGRWHVSLPTEQDV